MELSGSDLSNTTGWSGQQDRSSKGILLNLFDQTAKLEEVKKKEHSKVTALANSKKLIEFESLAFDKPAESAILKSLKLEGRTEGGKKKDVPIKLVASDISHLPRTSEYGGTNKMAYKNIIMWSGRAVALEQLLRPVVQVSCASWPDYETIRCMVRDATSAAAAAAILGEDVKLGMMDTLVVKLDEARELRYGFDRIFSNWSYSKEEFSLKMVGSKSNSARFVLPVYLSRCELHLTANIFITYIHMRMYRLFVIFLMIGVV